MMRWILLICVTLLTQACVNQTELAKEAVEADIPGEGKFSSRNITYRNIEDYPGKVVCGEYSTSRRASDSSFKPFIYKSSGISRHPSKEELTVFCSMDAQQSLYLSAGINFSGDSKAGLLLIRRDMNEIRAALEQYQSDQFRLPTSDEGIKSLTLPKQGKSGAAGYLEEVPLDPWGAPYIYAGPVFAGVEGNYKLLTLGADGKAGGKDENADVSWQHMKYLDHIDKLH